MKLHKSLTTARVMKAAKSNMFGTTNIGFCVYCGAEVDGVEPDAERYECDSCERRGVYGAEQILLYLA
jgi:anaerobic ribonucleoside-triphosphate reductase